jgi:eukaryotic-like serine/threonine-protein kinase
LNEAVDEFRKAIAIDPNYALAYSNLGNALYDQQKWNEAVAEYPKAIKLDPMNATTHYNFAEVLAAKQQWDEAIAEYRKAIALRPDYPEAYCNMGGMLKRQGRFAEALTAYRRGDELGRQHSDWRKPSAEWVRLAERLVAAEQKLPDFQKGDYLPEGSDERLALALVCCVKQLNHTAAGLYAEALAADPKAADDLKAAHRYRAACCALLAAAGEGKDADKLDDKERTGLRRQALDWLKADVDAGNKRLADGKPEDRQAMRAKFYAWQYDTALAAVRADDALKQLPPEEQVKWRQLWAEAAGLLKRASE